MLANLTTDQSLILSTIASWIRSANGWVIFWVLPDKLLVFSSMFFPENDLGTLKQSWIFFDIRGEGGRGGGGGAFLLKHPRLCCCQSRRTQARCGRWTFVVKIIVKMTGGTKTQGWAGMTFGLWERELELLSPFPNFGSGNEKLHSQLLGTGTGMINSIPNFWERERQILFPTFGNGNETLLFPGMIGNGNGLKKLGQI